MEKTSAIKRLARSKNFILFIVLAIVVLVFWLLKPVYLYPDNLRNIATSCAETGIMMIGIICLLISGNMDLSTGNVGALSAVIMALALQAGVPWGLGLLIGIMFGALCGVINSILAYVCGIFPFIATIAMSSVWSGVVNLITDAKSVVIANKGYWVMGSARVLGIPLPFVIMIVLMLIYGFLLSRTGFGRTIYIVGGNPQSARLAGVNLNKVGTVLMINCSAISAFTGCVMASRMHSASPNALSNTGMSAITAAVLGGVAFTGGAGSMVGGAIGLLLLNAFTNGLFIAGLSTYWRIVASGVLLIVALTFDFFNEKSIAKAIMKK